MANIYEFYELIVFDIHCFPKGRLITREHFEKVRKKGVGLYSGVCYFSIKDDPATSEYFGASRNFGNNYLVPIMDTVVQVPKSVRGDHLVAQILCEQRLPDGSTEMTNPRYVAQRQLEKLQHVGLKIKSSFEIEFSILDANYKPWGHMNKMANMDVLRENQPMLLDIVNELKRSDVSIDLLHPEAGPAQYEVTLKLSEGIEGPDMAARFKSFSRTLFKKRGLNAAFTTTFQKNSFSNGFHFNHSLWSNDGSNLFFDADQQCKLSKIGQEWLAGLIKHASAITALLCPTVNCYRRLHKPFCPTKSNWGSNDRFKTFRLVTECDGNIYLEARLPSSACNPYFVMAAIVAAGLDGITNHLSLDESDQEKELPRDLGSALEMLKNDSHIVEALGKDTVENFAIAKYVEIGVLGKFALGKDMKEELDLYLSRV